jgi:hypothetical protein
MEIDSFLNDTKDRLIRHQNIILMSKRMIDTNESKIELTRLLDLQFSKDRKIRLYSPSIYLWLRNNGYNNHEIALLYDVSVSNVQTTASRHRANILG